LGAIYVFRYGGICIAPLCGFFGRFKNRGCFGVAFYIFHVHGICKVDKKKPRRLSEEIIKVNDSVIMAFGEVKNPVDEITNREINDHAAHNSNHRLHSARGGVVNDAG